MRVLFYTMNWYPFEGSIQHIYAAVLRHMKQRGHDITILTSIPYFMNSRHERWESYRGKTFAQEQWEGIRVVRTYVWSPYFLRHFKLFIRALNCVCFSVTSLFAGLSLGKVDVILTVSHPPLLIGITSYLLSSVKRCPFIYCLEDIYPDILLDLNILKKGRFAGFLGKLERFIYHRAEKVCVLSPEMKQNLRGKGVAAKKIQIITHFADLDKVIPLTKQNDLAEEYRLDSDFVVLFPGSISYRYGIDNILAAAQRLSKQAGIKFVFVERGELRDFVKEQVRSKGLSNVKFVPFQPANRFPALLASSDLCLVTLETGFAPYSMPSKVYNIMASARPIVAVAEADSALAKLVRTADCGVMVPPGEPLLLAQAIQRLSTDKQKLRTMGRNGRAYAERYLDRDKICAQYEEVMLCTA
jgi:colanic acid biosynthesis glycosyl transferase WcaI